MRRPFFRKSKKAWYVKDAQGREIRLATDRDDAHREWAAMLRAGDVKSHDASAVAIIEEFLSEHQHTVSEEIFADFQRVTQSFADYIGHNTPWKKVTVAKVLAWLAAPKPGQLRKNGSRAIIAWSDSRKYDAGSIVRRVFAWAEDVDLIPKSPIRTLKLKRASPRKTVIDYNLHSTLVLKARESTKSKSFALYLIACRCGARPQQIRDVMASHVTQDCSRMIFEKHKTAHKTNAPLVVYASPCMQTLLKIMTAARPQGHLFVNDQQRPWLKDTVCQRMRRLRKELNLSDDIVTYVYRHTYATDALAAGVPIATVAALLGHKSPAMIANVYGHLEQHHDHLSNAAKRATRHNGQS